MGMKIDSVDKHTPSTTSQAVRTSAWTNNGGKVNTLNPSLRNILIGLSIGQMVMIVVSVATLGSFVNSNVRFTLRKHTHATYKKVFFFSFFFQQKKTKKKKKKKTFIGKTEIFTYLYFCSKHSL